MCVPVVAVGIGLAAVSMGMQLYGNYVRGKAAEQGANYQAGQLRSNANIAELAAGDVRQRTEAQAGRMRLSAGGRIGQGTAAVGSSGLSMAGSPAVALADERWLTEQDIQSLRSGGGRQAWGDLTQASQLRSEASAVQKSGQASALNLMLTGGAGALSTGMAYGQAQGWFSSGGSTAGGGVTVTPEMAQYWGNEQGLDPGSMNG